MLVPAAPGPHPPLESHTGKISFSIAFVSSLILFFFFELAPLPLWSVALFVGVLNKFLSKGRTVWHVDRIGT